MGMKKDKDNSQDVNFLNALLFDYETVVCVSETDEEVIQLRKGAVFGDFVNDVDLLNITNIFNRIADKYVLEEDKKNFFSKLSEEKIWRIIDEGNTFTYIYNYLINSDRVYYEICIRRSFISNNPYISIAFINVDSVVKNELKERHVEKKDQLVQEMAVINVLTEDYDFAGYITLGPTQEEDKISQFRTSMRIHKAIPDFNFIYDPTKRFRLLADSIVDEEYREDFMKQLRREVVIERLEKENVYFVNFIAKFDGVTCYYQLKFAADKGKDGSFKGMIVGIYSIDEAISLEKEHRKTEERALLEHQELLRSDSIIKTLASDYTVVYTANIETDEVRTESLSNDLINNGIFGLDILSIHSYKFRMNIIASTYVHPDDKQIFIENTVGSKVSEAIRNNKTIIVEFRMAFDSEYVHMQLKIVPNVIESSNEIVIGFRNVENEYRALVKAKNEENLRERIIRDLSENYSLICVVDYDSMNDTIFFYDDKYLRYVTGWKNTMPFSERIRIISEKIYDDSERRIFLDSLTKENLSIKLKFKDAIYVNYRVTVENKIEYWQLKVVGNTDNDKQIVVGFRRIEENTRKIIEMADIIKQNQGIIDILASEYTALYFVDLNRNTIKSYSQKKDASSYLGQIGDEDYIYSDHYKKTVDTIAYEPDKEALFKALSINNIKSVLKREKSYTHIFRTINGDILRYNELKVIKLGDIDDIPDIVALGFADRDSEILTKFVDKTIYSDYSVIFITDLKTNDLRIIKDEMNMGTYLRIETRAYSEIIDKYADFLEGESRELWKSLADINHLKEYLLHDNKKEVVYKLFEDIWLRCTIRVIEREKGIPVSVVFTFLKLDNDSANNIKLSRQIAVQNAELEKQQILLKEARIKAEEASKAKSEFLFNMSHDIRTPMNAIIGYTNMAKKHIGNEAQIDDCLNKIKVSGNHLLNLVNDVLDMSRIETGNLKIEKNDFCINDKITEIIDMCRELALSKNISLDVDISNIINPYVNADALHINQILMNVISNAIKYTKEFGYVKFKALQEIKGENADFKFIIEDNGIGMSKEFLERIYDNFTREKNSTMSGVEGTGLGMAIVKRLLSLMNGNINIESELNKGTKVTIDLELQLVNEVETHLDDIDISKLPMLKGARILIVEDNEMNREILSDLLDEYELDIDNAEDGDIAVSKIEEICDREEFNYYKYILMDVQMPRMNGLEATRQIRKILEKYNVHIPIFAMTANAFEEDKKKTMEAGMDAHLSKPVDIKALVNMLLKYID